MSEEAFGKRDLSGIRKRKILAYIFFGFKKIVNLVKTRTQISKFLVYPEVSNKKQLIKIINKLLWAIPYKKGLDITIPISFNFNRDELLDVEKVEYQENYLDRNSEHIKFCDPKTIKFSKFDSILITDKSKLFKFSILKNISKIDIIDETYYSSVESNVWKKIYYNVFPKGEIEKFKKISLANFSSLLKRNKTKASAYCFVTGPSFDRYKEIKYKRNSFKVVCNSIVKNEEFLAFIGGPDIIVFADPVFHFSPSKYSAEFRKKLIKVVNKYDCFVAVPFETFPILLTHYKELKSRLIGFSFQNKFNIPKENNVSVKKSSNILTLLMIPIASSVSGQIFIIGADGRKKGEKYFWKHSGSVQFTDLMETAFRCHPSFFRDRIYDKYYKHHCKFLGKLLEYGEKRGKEYYSLTNSYIDVLRKRTKGTVLK